MNIDKHDILRRFLDGELGDSELSEALQLFAADPDLRSLLRFDMSMRQSLSGPSSRVPDGFADRVMHSIDALEAVNAKSTPATQSVNAPAMESRETGTSESADNPMAGVIEWLSGFFEPRQVAWRPVWSAGLALGMLMLVLLSSWTTGLFLQQPAHEVFVPVTQVAEESADRVLMRFVYVDRDAESVAVAGDFSEWEPITLTRVNINGDQAWTGLIPLTRGEHRYMFIKDGEEWVTDPFAKTFRDDGFGNRNAVISL